MLGDTSMGMINGYFGPRLLEPARLHRAQGRSGVDHRPRPAHRRQRASTTPRASCRTRASPSTGARRGADGLRRATPRASSSATTWPCSTWSSEFKADCLGWQYQLGLIPLRPPSDFAEGLLQLDLPPRVERRHHRLRHRGRPGQRRADGADEAAAQGEGPAPGGDVPRRALGRRARRPLPLGAAQLRLVRRVRLQPRSGHAPRRALVPPAVALLPDPRRHVRRREPARQDDLGARVHPKDGVLWMDIGTGRGREAPARGARRVVGGDDARVAVHGRRHGHLAATR